MQYKLVIGSHQGKPLSFSNLSCLKSFYANTTTSVSANISQAITRSTLLVGLVCLCAISILPAQAAQVRIAVATNFKPTLSAIVAQLEANSSHSYLISAGSTGRLYAQIKNGAPYDIFLAADQHRPQLLVEAGLATIQFTYAVGRLVLMQHSKVHANPNAHTLADNNFRHLVIANPKLAPYGLAARQYIDSLALDEQLEEKLVVADNVGGAYAIVATGGAELGLVAMSQQTNSRFKHWPVPTGQHQPINQDLVLLRKGATNTAAVEFVDYMRSTHARQIVAAAGYQ